MKVAELARSAGVTADTVRYYARAGLLNPRRNAANGYREFSAVDARRLWFIKRAQSLGFSLGEVGTIMRQARQRKSPCPMVRDIIRRHIDHADDELEQLIQLRDRMRQALRRWKSRPDRVPVGDEICGLIELDGYEAAVGPAGTGVRARRGPRGLG